MLHGYIRVSTDKQTTENQQMAILKYCEYNHIDTSAINWIDETISGTKDPSKRKLGQLLKQVQTGDIIICTELSRLGRSLFMIMSVLQYCLDNGVKVYSIKEGFDLSDDISSKVLIFAFGLCAEIERKLISERTKEGLARTVANGTKLGRKCGSRNKTTKLSGQEDVVRELFKRNNTYAEVAKVMGVDRTTLMRFCRNNDIWRPGFEPDKKSKNEN